MSASDLSLNVETCYGNFQNVGVTFRGYTTPKTQVSERSFMFKISPIKAEVAIPPELPVKSKTDKSI